MGFRPDLTVATKRSDNADQAEHYFREAARLADKMLAALPSNRELIGHVKRNGLRKT